MHWRESSFNATFTYDAFVSVRKIWTNSNKSYVIGRNCMKNQNDIPHTKIIIITYAQVVVTVSLYINNDHFLDILSNMTFFYEFVLGNMSAENGLDMKKWQYLLWLNKMTQAHFAKLHIAHFWNIFKILQIVPCTKSHISWKFNKNPSAGVIIITNSQRNM